MKIKVGDKVRLKKLDEILSTNDRLGKRFRLDIDGDLLFTDGIALWNRELLYCGEEFEVFVVHDKKYVIIINEKVTINDVPVEILEPIKEIKLVDLNQAASSLINGECDAIRYHTNVSICAYRDTDSGVFKVAIYRGEDTSLNYTVEPFFMHEDYLVNSKWELIVDKAKRKEIEKQKERLIATLDTLYLLYGIDQETYKLIMDKVESI